MLLTGQEGVSEVWVFSENQASTWLTRVEGRGVRGKSGGGSRHWMATHGLCIPSMLPKTGSCPGVEVGIASEVSVCAPGWSRPGTAWGEATGIGKRGQFKERVKCSSLWKAMGPRKTGARWPLPFSQRLLPEVVIHGEGSHLLASAPRAFCTRPMVLPTGIPSAGLLSDDAVVALGRLQMWFPA